MFSPGAARPDRAEREVPRVTAAEQEMKRTISRSFEEILDGSRQATVSQLSAKFGKFTETFAQIVALNRRSETIAAQDMARLAKGINSDLEELVIQTTVNGPVEVLNNVRNQLMQFAMTTSQEGRDPRRCHANAARNVEVDRNQLRRDANVSEAINEKIATARGKLEDYQAVFDLVISNSTSVNYLIDQMNAISEAISADATSIRKARSKIGKDRRQRAGRYRV